MLYLLESSVINSDSMVSGQSAEITRTGKNRDLQHSHSQKQLRATFTFTFMFVRVCEEWGVQLH